MATPFQVLAVWHPGMWELIIMLLIILVLFGSRLPKIARSLGQGINQFKKGLSDPVKETPAEDDKEKPNLPP